MKTVTLLNNHINGLTITTLQGSRSTKELVDYVKSHIHLFDIDEIDYHEGGKVYSDEKIIVISGDNGHLYIEAIEMEMESDKTQFFHLPLNLQQGFIHTNKSDVCNTVCAIYSRHKQLVVIRPEYRREQEAICATIPEDFKIEHIAYGDSFGVETWDQKIAEF